LPDRKDKPDVGSLSYLLEEVACDHTRIQAVAGGCCGTARSILRLLSR
jgi:hypothetical protein